MFYKCKNIAAIMLALCVGQSWAADSVSINITGNIKAAPCKVDGSGSLTVSLGDEIPATMLQEANSTSPWENFSLSLSDCPANTTKVITTFTGSPAEFEPTKLYANATGEEYAKNVQVELQGQTDSTPLGNNQSLIVDVDNDSRSATVPLRTRLVSTQGNATLGAINSVIIATFTYQ